MAFELTLAFTVSVAFAVAWAAAFTAVSPTTTAAANRMRIVFFMIVCSSITFRPAEVGTVSSS